MCARELDNCHEKARCDATANGAYNCTCLPGFQGDGFVCKGWSTN